MTTPQGPTKPGPTTSPRGRRWPALVALALVFAGHGWLASRLFPSWGSIVDRGSPVLVVDHAIHEYHGGLGARFVRESGTTWGYDPSFMAGYPETPVWDSSSNPSIAFDLLGGSKAGDYRGYKVGLFLAPILALGALAAGARAAGLGAWEVAVASLLAGLYFWAGFPIVLWRSGLFAFLSASFGAALLLGLCARFDRRPGRWAWLALALCGSGLFFVHVTAPILAGGGALAFYAAVGRRHGWRWHASVLGAAAVTVAANLPWLGALWRFRSIRVGSGLFMTTDSAWYLLDYYLGPSVDARLGLASIVLGFVGLAGWAWRGRRGAAAAFGGSLVALIALTALGSLWGPTKVLEPLRFRVAFCLLLAVPAASSVVGGTRGLARGLGGGIHGALAATLAWVLALGGWAEADPLVFRELVRTVAIDRPLVVGTTPEMRGLVDWIRANTDLSGRILLEDQLRLLEPTDAESVHWTPLLPDLLGTDQRLFIGGLYQTAFIEHHRMAAFGDFQLGDRPIDAWSPAELAGYCRLYNVGWVAAWSPLSRFCLDRFPLASRVATIPRYSTPNRPVSANEHEWRAMIGRAGPAVARRYMIEGESSYAIYRVDRPRSYFLRGKGRIVAAGPNRVELADVEPEGGSALLSLHWLDTWKADPPAPLGPEAAGGDPVPFVRIEAAQAIPRLVLYNSRAKP